VGRRRKGYRFGVAEPRSPRRHLNRLGLSLMNVIHQICPKLHLMQLGARVLSMLLALGGVCTGTSHMQPTSSKGKVLSVDDVVKMTRFGRSISRADSAPNQLASFSPDGKKLALVLCKPDMMRDVNMFSIVLFNASEAFRSTEGITILQIRSSSDRSAIKNLKWLGDNETVIFIGEYDGKTSQVYAYDLRKRRVDALTNHGTAIDDYAIAPDGQAIVYVAERESSKHSKGNRGRDGGIVIRGRDLPSLLKGQYEVQDTWGRDLFIKRIGHTERMLATKDVLTEQSIVSLSPDARHVLLWGYRAEPLPQWVQYADPYIRQLAADTWNTGRPSPFRRYFVLNIQSGRMTDILGSLPTFTFKNLCWSTDGATLSIEKAWLPLAGVSPADRSARANEQYPVSVRIADGMFHQITPGEWTNASVGIHKDGSVDVTVDQSLNSPPKVYISGRNRTKQLLFDINPQLAHIDIGVAETVNWDDPGGRKSQGGLYLPNGYDPKKRYPLVIQTHGFAPDEFSMGGVSDWDGGFAARLLAVRGIAVLQCCTVSGYDDPSNEGEGSMRQIEGAITYLTKRGTIDPDRVGIMGFSRTVFQVGYTLTHSKMHFAAATLIDGIDGGYFQYLVWGPTDNVHINQAEPVGAGLQKWLAISPGFNLDKVIAPVRLEAHGDSDGLLGLWQWYAGLKYQNKPVEMTLLPNASHIPKRPWERRVAADQEVDWMLFWLKDEQDKNPVKKDEYERWNKLRALWGESSLAR
jgi:dipeptidyl aminopeptidase/acylaminoacyl peptidase